MTTRPGRVARALAVLDDRVDGDAHQPGRPGWDCHACAEPWPCAPAKVRLSEAYGRDRIGLRMYMAALYEQALDELLMWPAADVFARFVGWAR